MVVTVVVVLLLLLRHGGLVVRGTVVCVALLCNCAGEGGGRQEMRGRR